MSKFKHGDRVRVRENCGWKPWVGLTGVVTGTNDRGHVNMRSDTPIPDWNSDILFLEPHKYALIEGVKVSNELEEYKKLVLEEAVKAKEYVDAHDEWCDSRFKETLQRLGLEVPVKRYAPDDTFKGGTIFFSTVVTYYYLKNESDGKWYKKHWYGQQTSVQSYSSLEEAFKDSDHHSYTKDSVPINDGWHNSNYGR